MVEDISNEKRVQVDARRATWTQTSPTGCCRPSAREEILGGTESMATVLFSDVRSFTTHRGAARAARHGRAC